MDHGNNKNFTYLPPIESNLLTNFNGVVLKDNFLKMFFSTSFRVFMRW